MDINATPTRHFDPSQNGAQPWWSVDGLRYSTKAKAIAAQAKAADPAVARADLDSYFDTYEDSFDACTAFAELEDTAFVITGLGTPNLSIAWVDGWDAARVGEVLDSIVANID